MKQRFGLTLRDLRIKAHKSMGDLARHLGLSVTYISDVERGNRAPFTRENIRKVAKFLGVDPQALLVAATDWGDYLEIELDQNPNPKSREVGVSLLRGWGNLQDEDFDKIQQILNKRDKLFRLITDTDSLDDLAQGSIHGGEGEDYLWFLNNADIRRTRQWGMWTLSNTLARSVGLLLLIVLSRNPYLYSIFLSALINIK